jgi:hypothetical protein
VLIRAGFTALGMIVPHFHTRHSSALADPELGGRYRGYLFFAFADHRICGSFAH